MSDEKQRASLLSRWNSLHLQDKCSSLEPSLKSHVLRELLGQVEWARAANLLSAHGYSYMFHQYADAYAGLIDSPQDLQGMDNFAEGALAQQTGRRNESKDWHTSFTRQSITKLPCVERCINVAKVAQKHIVAEGRENETLLVGSDGTMSDGGGRRLTNPAHDRMVPVTGTRTTQQPVRTMSYHAPDNKPSTLPSGQNSHFAIGQKSSTAPAPTHLNMTRFPSGEVDAQDNRPVESERSNFWNLASKQQKPVINRNASTTSRPNSTGNLFSGSSAFSRSTHDQSSCIRRTEPQKRPFHEVDSDGENENDRANVGSSFKTAREQLAIDKQKKFGRNQHSDGRGSGYGSGDGNNSVNTGAYGSNKRSLGTRRGLNSKFVPPVLNREDEVEDGDGSMRRPVSKNGNRTQNPAEEEEPVDERLKNIEEKMIELIKNEIMDHGPPLTWDDIAGLEFAKKTIKEIVVWPMLRPDIFTGLRGPPKGLLLFGPPGTGKTLIGKCIASQSKSTFFSISASSLTSKWVGEGEKMVRALFAVARVHEPAVIFIDEIDSLLSQRTDGEHEASRRIKTEFLVQLDGVTSGVQERVLVVGATNRPQEIDEAARRRFVKRLYIPLPEAIARRQIVSNLLAKQSNELTGEDLDQICVDTDGYSGADMANLCREAALGPIRSMDFSEIENISADQVRPIVFTDFKKALNQVRPSVSSKDLDVYLDWNKMFGSWEI